MSYSNSLLAEKIILGSEKDNPYWTLNDDILISSGVMMLQEFINPKKTRRWVVF